MSLRPPIPAITADAVTGPRRRFHRARFARAARPLPTAPEWPADRLQRLIDGYATGVGVDEIAATLGVTRARVLHKARALGLTHRSRQRRRPSVPVEGEKATPTATAPVRPLLDDRNPLGPVARALTELAERVRETRDGFVLDRCPASVFRLIEVANGRLAAQGLAPIRVRAARRPARAWAGES